MDTEKLYTWGVGNDFTYLPTVLGGRWANGHFSFVCFDIAHLDFRFTILNLNFLFTEVKAKGNPART